MLKKYNTKRNFKKTPEPKGISKKTKTRNLIFVVQKHHARNLHYDFRLEFDGALKSWAVPKGPSLDPADKRLAVEVEDHPIDYANFEGEIPKGEYGAGQVIVWDKGTWSPPEDFAAAVKKGHLIFELHGQKLKGKWSLVRMGKPSEKNNWLLLKTKDRFAHVDYDVVAEETESVLKTKKKKKNTGKTLSPPPEFVKPQLAQLVEKVPSGTDWLHEIKFDGYRTLCRIDGDEIRFLTRGGQDWSAKYKKLIDTAKKLKLENALLDGELVWVNENGQIDFQKLQNALSENKFDHVVYYIFDLLFLNGEDLREKSLRDRKAALEKLLKPMQKTPFRYSEHWQNRGEQMFKESCRLKLEGVVSKSADSSYISGRSGIWKKTKCSLRQEFVIGGYTSSGADHRLFGALLLGAYENNGKNLRYVGRVGTGFSNSTLAEILKKFNDLEQDESPFTINSPTGRAVHWLKPSMVAEVEFKSWTSDQILRHASFQGLREDKKAKEIFIDMVEKNRSGKFDDKWISDIVITNPDRIVYPKHGIVKNDVIEYYKTVSELMFPFVADRPISILRCQKTTAAECYFQKHSEGRNLVGISSKSVHYKDKRDTALSLESPADIIRLAQAGTIEIHGWGSTFTNVGRPDQIIFDLDPESKKLWGRVVDTALEIREMLARLGLRSFVKVTGGKGLHVQVPISPLYSWDAIKIFSKSLMQILVEKEPQHYTTNMSKSKREGRIFLDYLRNGYGATAVIPYSLRAHEQPNIALPIAWKDLKTSLVPDSFVYPDVIKLIKKRKDPWIDYLGLQQRIKFLEHNKTDWRSLSV